MTGKFSEDEIRDLMGSSSYMEYSSGLANSGDPYEDADNFEYQFSVADEEDEEDDDDVEGTRGIIPPSNAGRRWAQIEDQNLIDEYVSGSTITSLASRHGRSIRAIWMRLVALSFQAEPNIAISLKSNKYELTEWTEDSKSVLRASVESGLEVATVATVLGLDGVDVAKQIVELGLARPVVLPKYREKSANRRWTSSELSQLREDFRNEMPIDLMAQNAQRSKVAVLGMLYALEEISDDEVNHMLSQAASSAYGN